MNNFACVVHSYIYQNFSGRCCLLFWINFWATKSFGKCKTKAVTTHCNITQHAQWYGGGQLGPEICLMNKIEVRFGFTSWVQCSGVVVLSSPPSALLGSASTNNFSRPSGTICAICNFCSPVLKLLLDYWVSLLISKIICHWGLVSLNHKKFVQYTNKSRFMFKMQ